MLASLALFLHVAGMGAPGANARIGLAPGSAPSAQIPELTRLRTVLPNGAVVLVERVKDIPDVQVQLWVSAAGTWDRFETQGQRHLLEHLAALGHDGNIDRDLETAGGFLRAETYRETMAFRITAPTPGLPRALAALGSVMKPRRYTEAEVATEARIIQEEAATRTPVTLLSAYWWERLYGESGLDPFGNLDVIRTTTPDQLAELKTSMFRGSQVALVVVGDVDLDTTTAQVKAVIGGLPPAPPLIPKPAPRPASGTLKRPSGYACAVKTDSFRTVETLANIAAGLALAADFPQGYMLYTPSNQPGLVTVGDTTGADMRAQIAAADADGLFARGRGLAEAWVRRQLADPERIAESRGRLLCQSPSLRPEAILENLPALTVDRFRAAIRRFQVAP